MTKIRYLISNVFGGVIRFAVATGLAALAAIYGFVPAEWVQAFITSPPGGSPIGLPD